MAENRSILFVDAYDSFAQNIAALLHQELNASVTIIQIDEDVPVKYNCSLADFVRRFAAIVLGPGPGDPRDGASATGIFQKIIQHATEWSVPVLGICLGFQTLCVTNGLPVQRLDLPCHGHAKKIIPINNVANSIRGRRNVFEGLDANDIYATCYNSLGVFVGQDARDTNDSRPGSSATNASFGSASSFHYSPDAPSSDATKSLVILAVDETGYAMAVMHSVNPFWGFQFHPESCKSSDSCRLLLKNWFSAAVDHNILTQHGRNPNRQIARSECLLNGIEKDGLGWDSMIRDERQSNALDSLLMQSNAIPKEEKEETALHNRNKGPTEERQYTSSRMQDWDRRILCDTLVSATKPSRSEVHWRKVSGYTREDVADFIHESSMDTSTAMLESTKKGRFSIYALAHGVAPRGTFAGKISPGHSSFHLQASGDYLKLDVTSDRAHSADSEPTSPRSMAGQFHVQRHRGWSTRSDLIDAIADFMIAKRASGGPKEIPFWGGLIGYISYEFGLEGLACQAMDAVSGSQCRNSDLSLLWIERCLVHDAQTSTVYIQTLREDDMAFLDCMTAALASKRLPSVRKAEQSDVAFTGRLRRALSTGTIMLPDRREYDKAYDQCQKELRAGNSYELCLTTEARVSLPDLPQKLAYGLYKNMNIHNPVPYSAFLDFPDQTILSTSPEEFMSWSRDTGTINMLPMKGTVKRTPDMTISRATAILNTPKESAENLMIADLIRHDLYKAIGYKSKVEVVKLCEVVQHETVYQLISHIRAYPPLMSTQLPSSADARRKQIIRHGVRTLTSSLPPGSMTGAPKKKSCEILARLENRKRGVYSGVIGYFDVGGGGAWSVCIRTAFRPKDDDREQQEPQSQDQTRTTRGHPKNGAETNASSVSPPSTSNPKEWIIGAGGAITVLSDKQGEWDEMMVKFGSVLKGFKDVAGLPVDTVSPLVSSTLASSTTPAS